MAVADIGRFRRVGFSENQMPDHAEPGTFPRGHEAIDAVPAVEAHHQRVFFEDAIHLIAGRLEPFVGFVTGNTAAGTVTKPDQIRGIGEDEINGAIRKGGHNIDAVTQDKTGHRDTSWLQGAPRRTSVRRPFPAARSLYAATGNGSTPTME